MGVVVDVVAIFSQCMYPGYVGNGVTCTVDSDYDGYPDIPLDSCNAATSNEKYCIQVMIRNILCVYHTCMLSCNL